MHIVFHSKQNVFRITKKMLNAFKNSCNEMILYNKESKSLNINENESFTKVLRESLRFIDNNNDWNSESIFFFYILIRSL